MITLDADEKRDLLRPLVTDLVAAGLPPEAVKTIAQRVLDGALRTAAQRPTTATFADESEDGPHFRAAFAAEDVARLSDYFAARESTRARCTGTSGCQCARSPTRPGCGASRSPGTGAGWTGRSSVSGRSAGPHDRPRPHGRPPLVGHHGGGTNATRAATVTISATSPKWSGAVGRVEER